MRRCSGRLPPKARILRRIRTVSYKNNKARFRVSWMSDVGTNRAGEMGVQIIDPAKCIWDAATLPPATSDMYAAKGKERRSTGVCRANWALSVMQGSEALVRVDVRDISEGGCFVEMHTLPPDQEQVKIMVWANNTKLAMRGIVASRRPGFGISVKFTEMTEQVRQQLRFYIESVIVKQEVGKILVDLCTGDKYKILSVAKPRDRTKLPDLQTWPAGKCTDEEIAQLRKDGGCTLRAECKPFTVARWARTAC